MEIHTGQNTQYFQTIQRYCCLWISKFLVNALWRYPIGKQAPFHQWGEFVNRNKQKTNKQKTTAEKQTNKQNQNQNKQKTAGKCFRPVMKLSENFLVFCIHIMLQRLISAQTSVMVHIHITTWNFNRQKIEIQQKLFKDTKSQKNKKQNKTKKNPKKQNN